MSERISSRLNIATIGAEALVGVGIGLAVQAYRDFKESKADELWSRLEYPEIDPYPDDPTHRFTNYKRLGLISVSELPKHIPLKLDEQITIEASDPIMEICMGSQQDRSKPFIRTGESLKLLAEYIQIHDINVSYLIGITRRNLAEVSRRYGFSVAPNKSRTMNNRVKDGFMRSKRLGFIDEDEEMNGTYVVYQRREDFLARFGH